jgi:hypothetical protein
MSAPDHAPGTLGDVVRKRASHPRVGQFVERCARIVFANWPTCKRGGRALRQADLRRIHELWEAHEIDGMYTLAMLEDFRTDLETAAHRHGLT